jgi:hypothetical protein
MRISEELSFHLSLYLNGNLSLGAFRDWHIGELLNRHQHSLEDQEALAYIEAIYSQHLSGMPPKAFNSSLASLLSPKPNFNFQPVQEESNSRTDYCLV